MARILAVNRQIRRNQERRAAAERAETKALAACADGWATIPGSGVQFATIRRMLEKGSVEWESVMDGKIQGRFRKAQP